ncbi:FCD domain-containing protein [Pseudomonas sp. NPDC007930]|uniref:GntR family transcriptional regulator n=1 Tax=Pseudomonas sp. NPDC007930 TaxID=3364417 RepID=UPI0036E821FA
MPTPNPLPTPGADDVYSAIKQGIAQAHYAPGAHLREAHLAEAYGVSRTPVREAFRRLGAEGWLEVLPHRGARVKQWSVRDIEEIFEARALIEPYLAAQAAHHLGQGQLDELLALAEHMAALNASGDPQAVTEAWFAANKRFHDVINEGAGNRRLLASLQALKEVPLIKWTFATFGQADRARSVRQHFELVQALRARNPQWVEAVMRSHLLAAQASVLENAHRR